MDPNNIRQSFALMENEWVKKIFKKKAIHRYAVKAVSNNHWNGDCICLYYGMIRNKQNGIANITVEIDNNYKWKRWTKVAHHYLLVIAIMSSTRYIMFKSKDSDRVRYYFISPISASRQGTILGKEVTLFDIFADCKRYEKMKK